jgi:thiazole/oxazole-forming peptide maturase SagD family component
MWYIAGVVFMSILSYKEISYHQGPKENRRRLKPSLSLLSRSRFSGSFRAWLGAFATLPLQFLVNWYTSRVNRSRQVRFGYGLALNHHWRTVMWPWITRSFIKSVEFDQPFVSEPELYHMSVRMRPLPGTTDGKLIDRPYCRGRDFTYDRAITKAIGEVLERYPFTLYRENDLLHLTLDACAASGRDFLDVTTLDFFPDYDETKQQLEQYRHEKPISWVPVKRITDIGTEVDSLVPAQFVYWNYDYDRSNQIRLHESSTHGGAAYYNLPGALHRALSEWIGRDGFFYHWGLSVTPSALEIDSVAREAQGDFKRLLAFTRQSNCTVRFLDVTSPKISLPSIACVLHHPNDPSGCFWTVGAGCNVQLLDACHEALSEAWGMHQWLATFFPHSRVFQDRPVTEWGDYERLTYFASGSGTKDLEIFMVGEEKPVNYFLNQYPKPTTTTDAELLTYITSLCLQHDDVAIYYTEPLPTANFPMLGHYAVRTFVSGLIPPYQYMQHIPLQALYNRGIHDDVISEWSQINTSPHPYP